MRKSIVILITMILAALLFAGCQDVIFAKIMGEVELEDGEINGHINSIVRFNAGGNEMLYTANGVVYAKYATNQSHGAWSKAMNGISTLSYNYFDRSFSGVYVSYLAVGTENSTADETLYALALEVEEDRDEGENYFGTHWLYRSTDGYSWTLVGNVGNRYSGTVIFCTNTIKNENRKAFIRMNGNVYALSRSWSPFSPTDNMTTVNTTEGASIVSVLWYNGHANFFSTSAVATNETATRESPTCIYRAIGSTLQYATVSGSGEPSWVLYGDSAASRILSIAVTSDTVILGTEGDGLYKVSVDGNGIPNGIINNNFLTNADTALESPYRIYALLCADPSMSEMVASIYAAADFRGSPSSSGGSDKDIGLWSYYPGRGNWNRE